MHQLGMIYWETYYPVVNWISIKAMLTLKIFRDLHNKLVDCVLAYIQSDLKPKIFMEIPICFGVEGDHPR